MVVIHSLAEYVTRDEEDSENREFDGLGDLGDVGFREHENGNSGFSDAIELVGGRELDVLVVALDLGSEQLFKGMVVNVNESHMFRLFDRLVTLCFLFRWGHKKETIVRIQFSDRSFRCLNL